MGNKKKKKNLKNYISYVLVFFYMRQKEACWCHLHEIKNKFILMIFKLTAVIHASLKLQHLGLCVWMRSIILATIRSRKWNGKTIKTSQRQTNILSLRTGYFQSFQNYITVCDVTLSQRIKDSSTNHKDLYCIVSPIH